MDMHGADGKLPGEADETSQGTNPGIHSRQSCCSSTCLNGIS